MTTLNDQLRGSIAAEEEIRGIVVSDRRSASLVPAAPLDPMQELQMRIIREGDIDKLQKLMDLEERWSKGQALRAYNEAMAKFKAVPITIKKNKHVGFESKNGGSRTDYWHATLDNVCACVAPVLADHGLRHTWDVKEAQGQITVTCTVTHELGHSESVSLSGPLDATGNKNQIQQKGSTITYLERYTFLAITGLATVDQDNDGRVASTPAEAESFMDEAEAANFLDLIEASDTIEQVEKNYFKALDAAQKAKDVRAAVAFEKAKNKRGTQIVRAQKAGNHA